MRGFEKGMENVFVEATLALIELTILKCEIYNFNHLQNLRPME